MNCRPRASFRRGIALITSLLAVVLIMALLAFMVNIGTARLRRTTQEFRSLQALAAADAGASWVRALLAQHAGDLGDVLSDLAAAHSTTSLAIDADTTADVLVSLQLPGASEHADHLDVELQENPQIVEAPLQVVSTATVITGGRVVATRTVTTLLRSFHHAQPYSEIVGVIDDAGLKQSTLPVIRRVRSGQRTLRISGSRPTSRPHPERRFPPTTSRTIRGRMGMPARPASCREAARDIAC